MIYHFVETAASKAKWPHGRKARSFRGVATRLDGKQRQRNQQNVRAQEMPGSLRKPTCLRESDVGKSSSLVEYLCNLESKDCQAQNGEWWMEIWRQQEERAVKRVTPAHLRGQEAAGGQRLAKVAHPAAGLFRWSAERHKHKQTNK